MFREGGARLLPVSRHYYQFCKNFVISFTFVFFVIDVMLLASDVMPSLPDGLMELLNENQLSFTRAGDRRLWHRYHRVLPMGLLPVIAKRCGRFNTGGGNADSAYAIGVMVGAPLMTAACRIAPDAMR